MHPPHFMEPQKSSHFSSQPTTCPYFEPAEPSPRKHTTFLWDSFYKMCVCVCVCTSGHFLSGIRTQEPGHNSFHTNTCHMHCHSHSSGCCSVPSCVSVSLETAASILVVLVADIYYDFCYLLLRDVSVGADMLTSWPPGHIRKQPYKIRIYI